MRDLYNTFDANPFYIKLEVSVIDRSTRWQYKSRILWRLWFHIEDGMPVVHWHVLVYRINVNKHLEKRMTIAFAKYLQRALEWTLLKLITQLLLEGWCYHPNRYILNRSNYVLKAFGLTLWNRFKANHVHWQFLDVQIHFKTTLFSTGLGGLSVMRAGPQTRNSPSVCSGLGLRHGRC